MKNISQLGKIFVLIFFLLGPLNLFAQHIEPKKRIIEPDHVISSKIMDKDYQLFISFPKNYTLKDTISYPVLYVLDGIFYFQGFSSSQNNLSYNDEIEDVIIVGVSSGIELATLEKERFYDYTPTSLPSTDRKYEKRMKFDKNSVKTGGADKFLECLKSEIIPFVENKYKTNLDRGLCGHSLGGLFTAYCLINSDGYFRRFGINSPSLFWDGGMVLNKAIQQIEDNKTWNIPATKVFISVGGKEGRNMVPQMMKLALELKSRQYENIELTYQIFDHETHLSVMAANMSRTISVLYDKEKK